MSKVAEAYKAGRAIVPRWTNNDLLEKDNRRLKACAIGAFGVGLGILSKEDIDPFYGQVNSDATRRVRDAFNKLLVDGTVPYECRHRNLEYFNEADASTVIEHYSDEHRRSLGKDENLIAMMDKYARN